MFSGQVSEGVGSAVISLISAVVSNATRIVTAQKEYVSAFIVSPFTTVVRWAILAHGILLCKTIKNPDQHCASRGTYNRCKISERPERQDIRPRA